MNTTDFYEKYVNEDNNENEWGECFGDDDELILMTYDEETEHKSIITTSVYKLTLGDEVEYFEVSWSRDNCGYWSDGERYPGEVRKVKPVTSTVVVTEYMSA